MGNQLRGIVNRWRASALGMCALGGLGMALAMPPYGLWLLAWVAIVPLWRWTIVAQADAGIATPLNDLQTNPQNNLQLGWPRRLAYAAVWTALYEGITTHWIWDLHPLTWMGIPWGPSLAIALLAWLAVIAGRLLFVVLWTQLTARLARGRSPWLRVLVGVAICCALDWLWSLGPLYWNSFGLSQSPGNLAILQWGRLGGPTAVMGAIVAVNGLLAEAWLLACQLQPHAGRASGARQRLVLVRQLWGGAMVLAITLHGLGAWMYSQATASVAADERTVTPVTIGIVQGNVPTREKLSAKGIRLGVERYAAGFRELAGQGADAVLLPEGALPFVWSREREYWGQPLLQAIAAYPETELWLGTFDLSSNGGTPHANALSQSLVNLDAEGQVQGRYDKVKLVPLGEYVPGGQGLQSALEAVGIGRLSSLPVGMLPGQRSQIFESGLGRVAVMICYEPAFSGVMRRQVAQGGRWLVTSSNLDPYGEQLMAQAEALDVMRAVEGDRWGIRATNTGFSGVVDAAGRVRWRSTAGEMVTDLAEVYPRESQTVYVRWGNWLVWGLLGLAGVGLLGKR